LLSLVRTKSVGHLRDVRRLIVAMSRARLGLYIFCRKALFQSCYDLTPAFDILLKRPTQLHLNLDEVWVHQSLFSFFLPLSFFIFSFIYRVKFRICFLSFPTTRKANEVGASTTMADVTSFGRLVYDLSLEQSRRLEAAYKEQQARAQETEKEQLEELDKMVEDSEKEKERIKEERAMEKARKKHEALEKKRLASLKIDGNDDDEIMDNTVSTTPGFKFGGDDDDDDDE